jgi:hypothetical protein
MANEHIAPKGYFALKKQTNESTVATPDTYGILYKESFSTDAHIDEDTPVFGQKFRRLQSLPGQRSHGGEVSVLGEPQTASLLADNLLTKSSTSGSNPYTHSFGASNATDPNYYTYDFSDGEHVFRFWGVSLTSLAPEWDGNKLKFKAKGSARGSFHGRRVASIASQIITLQSDNYDAAPTVGLVVGDLVRVRLAAGTTVDLVVSSFTATTVTVTGTVTGVAAGDFLHLRPATVALDFKTAFLFARTEYRLSTVDAATALSATHTPMEKASGWEVSHKLANDDGEMRSGSFDPAALVRMTVDGSLKLKKAFDSKAELASFAANSKLAVVIRYFSEAGYEFRLTFNDMRFKTSPKPLMETESICYSDMDLIPNFSTTDTQALDIKVINARPTV